MSEINFNLLNYVSALFNTPNLKSYVNSPLITRFLGDKMLLWFKHSSKNIKDGIIYPQGTIIISNHLGKDIDVELLDENRTVLSTPIENGDTLYTRQSPEVYTIVITPEGEKQLKEQFELRGCLALVVLESPIRNNVEILLTQCSGVLSSLSDGFEFKSNKSFANLLESIR